MEAADKAAARSQCQADRLADDAPATTPTDRSTVEISAKPTSRSSAAWAIAFQAACRTAASEHQDDDERSGVEVHSAP